MRNISKIIVILILGAIGGFLFQVLILPFLIKQPFFEKFEFIKNLKERQIIVNPKEEIIIQENVALTKAIDKVEKAIIGIQSKTKSGAGVIMTSDGLAVTLNEIIPAGSNYDVFVDGEKVNFKILNRDVKENLASLKIEKSDLLTCKFADLEKIKLGQRVFLKGVVFEQGTPKKVVNEGIIKSFDENTIQTNILEKSSLKGAGLFNLEGEILGLVVINNNGEVSAIPITKIRLFLKL